MLVIEAPRPVNERNATTRDLCFNNFDATRRVLLVFGYYLL